mgnify:FL=1
MSSRYGLIFHAENPLFAPLDAEKFTEHLRSAGFLGEYFESAHQSGFLIGDEFLKQILFLGCSPNIEIIPPEHTADLANFCYIELKQESRPVFIKGLQRLKCVCPACKTRINAVPLEPGTWHPGNHSLKCPKCRQNTLLEHLDWKQTAGFGKYFIVIHNVFPHEAVPTDKLLKILQLPGAQIWRYFYFEQ